jgi:FMN phosphatase YigB (HAD superfamily)
MSAEEPDTVAGSYPHLGGVLLVTGSGDEKPPLGGRTQVVFGIMDTVVRDPFPQVAPTFFGMPLSELDQLINGSAWEAFERGDIEETELRKTYFKDGRDFDLDGLKTALVEGYELIEGMPELFQDLQAAGHKLHAFTDYPEWYALIEDKLAVEAKHGLQWTSVSCDTGLLKSDPSAYLSLLRRLGVRRRLGAAPVLFIDNEAKNCEGGEKLGISSVQFKDAEQLRKTLGDILGSRKRGTAPVEGWPNRVMR